MNVTVINYQDDSSPLRPVDQEVIQPLLDSPIMSHLNFSKSEELEKVFSIASQTPLENGTVLIQMEGGRLAFVDEEKIIFTNSENSFASGAFAQMHFAVVVDRETQTIDETSTLFRRTVDMGIVPSHKLEMFQHSYETEALSQTSRDYEMRSSLKGTPNIQEPPKKVMVLTGTGAGQIGSLEKNYQMEWGDYVQDGEFTEDQKKSQIEDVVRGYGGCSAKEIIVSDVKPDNCLVDENGTVFVSDLGGARTEFELGVKFKTAHTVMTQEGGDPTVKEKVFKDLVGTRNMAFSRDAETYSLLENCVISQDYDTFRQIIEKSDVHAMGVSFVYLYLEDKKIEGESLFSCVVHSNDPEYENKDVNVQSVVSEDLTATEAQQKYKELVEKQVIPMMQETFLELGFEEAQAALLSKTVHPEMAQVPTMLEVYEALGNELESVNFSMKDVIDFASRNQCKTLEETITKYQEKKGIKKREGVEKAFKKPFLAEADCEAAFKRELTAKNQGLT